jgi:hypothetical protein
MHSRVVRCCFVSWSLQVYVYFLECSSHEKQFISKSHIAAILNRILQAPTFRQGNCCITTQSRTDMLLQTESLLHFLGLTNNNGERERKKKREKENVLGVYVWRGKVTHQVCPSRFD